MPVDPNLTLCERSQPEFITIFILFIVTSLNSSMGTGTKNMACPTLNGWWCSRQPLGLFHICLLIPKIHGYNFYARCGYWKKGSWYQSINPGCQSNVVNLYPRCIKVLDGHETGLLFCDVLIKITLMVCDRQVGVFSYLGLIIPTVP